MAYQTSRHIYTTVCTCQILVEREAFIFVSICETGGTMEVKQNPFFHFPRCLAVKETTHDVWSL